MAAQQDRFAPRDVAATKGINRTARAYTRLATVVRVVRSIDVFTFRTAGHGALSAVRIMFKYIYAYSKL